MENTTLSDLPHDCLDIVREYLTRNDLLRLRAVCKDLHTYVNSLQYYWRCEYIYCTKPDSCTVGYKYCNKLKQDCVIGYIYSFFNGGYKHYFTRCNRNICKELEKYGAFTEPWSQRNGASAILSDFFSCSCNKHGSNMYRKVNSDLLENAVDLIISKCKVKCSNPDHKRPVRKYPEFKKQTKHNYINKIALFYAKKAVKSWTPNREKELKELTNFRDRAASANKLLKIVGSV